MCLTQCVGNLRLTFLRSRVSDVLSSYLLQKSIFLIQQSSTINFSYRPVRDAKRERRGADIRRLTQITTIMLATFYLCIFKLLYQLLSYSHRRCMRITWHILRGIFKLFTLTWLKICSSDFRGRLERRSGALGASGRNYEDRVRSE